MNYDFRGVIWEESIILIQPHIRHLYLSATIPNAKQFACWVCYLKNSPISVISTTRRPVPICHYVMPVGSDKTIQIINTNGIFHESKHAEAMDKLDWRRRGGRRRR
ncbi:hypothetical protein PMAYCL1PPCAC_05354, partial [Pristionchus mayeri]